MIKRLLVGMLLVVPTVHADWIDDLVPAVENEAFDQLRAEQTILQFIDEDKRTIERLEKKADANHEDGFWATLRGGTYQLQWATAQASLNYHKKVFEFIKSLPKNERDRTHLIEQLLLLKKNREELVKLKEDYSKAIGWKASLLCGGYVAAKELQIKGRKAIIKSSFVI